MTKRWWAYFASYYHDRRWNWYLRAHRCNGAVRAHFGYSRRSTARRGLKRALKRLGIDPRDVEIDPAQTKDTDHA